MMTGKLCPLSFNKENSRSCLGIDCAWWTGDRCAVVPPPMEVLTVEEADKTTSVYVSVDGPDQENVVQALAAALGGKL